MPDALQSSAGRHMLRAMLSRIVLWFAVLLMGVPAAHAADLRNVLTDYAISSWTEREGLPPGRAWALLQDRAGYLWLALDAGLVRFDGVRFVKWSTRDARVPSRPARALHLDRDGALWVAFAGPGGVIRLSEGEAREYGANEGLTTSAISALVEDQAGRLWAATDSGLFAFDGAKWLARSRELELPDVSIQGAFIDSRQRFYVGTQLGVFVREPGGRHFTPIEVLVDGVYQPARGRTVSPPRSARTTDALGRVSVSTRSVPRYFVEDARGRVLVNDWNTAFRVAGASDGGAEQGRGSQLLVDRKGHLWVGTGGQGLWRVKFDGNRQIVERATSMMGMSSDGITTVTEDRDGNIWATVAGSLTRLTPRRILQRTNYGLVTGIEVTLDNYVWIGGAGHELMRLAPGPEESEPLRFPLHNARLRTMHADRYGTVWFATDERLGRLRGARPQLEYLPAMKELRQIDLISSDAAGRIWLYSQENRLLRWENGQVVPFTLPVSASAAQIALLYNDRKDRLWAALADGRVVIVDGSGEMSLHGPDEGLNIGTCRQIFEDDDGEIWLGGVDGLSRFRDDHFITLESKRGFPLSDLVAIEEDRSHNLWIGTSNGVVRVARSDLDGMLTGQSKELRYDLFRIFDGLAGSPNAYDSNRRVVRTVDGVLWFVTARGLSLIDPAALPGPAVPSPVTIEYVTADDRVVPVGPNIQLRPRTARLEIGYSELDLNSPLRPRFRYRLDGIDRDWVDAEIRVSALYSNLPPGNYRFHVVSVNPDGTHAPPGATLAIAVPPMFYQTTWFAVAAAVTLAVSIWGGWRLRIRRVRKQFAALISERVRLSRELHDTLLQNLVGIALQFDAFAADTDSTDPGMRRRFVRMRKQVEEQIREARQSIWDMRSSRSVPRDLVSSLRDIGNRVTAEESLDFELVIDGEPRRLAPQVEEQLVRIGQEAITNAVRHSHGSRVHVAVRYQERSLALNVQDDGCGFDAAGVSDHTIDHYGLTTMRERAEQIGALFEIDSGPRSGTRVTAVVSA